MQKTLETKIEKANVEDILELSMFQKGILFHYQKEANDNLYNVQVSFLIDGNIDVDRLTEAFLVVQSKNEALRSVFRWEQVSKPLQIILKTAPFANKFNDLSQKDPETIKHLANEYLESDRNARFDLTVLPLRLRLIKISVQSLILSITHHHLLYDGWSTGILVKELFYSYYHLSKKEVPVFADKPLYKSVLKAMQKHSFPEKAASYWRDYLKGYKINSFFSNAFMSGSEKSEVRRYKSSIPISKIEEFAATYKITKASIVYAAYGILLQIHNNVTDVVFGATVSNRDSFISGGENVMGNFINTIPIRIDSNNEYTLLELARKVNKEVISRSEFSFTSYFEIKQLINLKPADNLFDSVIVIENYPLDEKLINSNNDLLIKLNSVYENTGIPLGVYVFFKEGLDIDFVYSSSILHDSRVASMADHLMAIINLIVEAPDQLVKSLDLFPEKERVIVFNEITNYKQSSFNENGLTPVSCHQERLWFIDQFEAGYLYKVSPVYHNIPLCIDFDGKMDAGLLQEVIEAEMQMHEILRTSICTLNEIPFQKLSEKLDFKLKVETLTGETKISDLLIWEEINIPFKLDGALVRGTLYNVGANKYRLVLIFHHLIMDRYSITRLQENILWTYSVSLKRQKREVARSLLLYSGFSLWQKVSLSKLEPYYLRYWKQQLGSKLKAIEFPTDRPRAAIHTYTAGTEEVIFCPAIVSRILEYSEKQGISINLMLMAAFKVLLYKYAQHEEIVIGTSIDNREDLHNKDGLGPISNLIALRSFVSPDSCFNEYAAKLEKIYADGIKYGAMPFDKLVKELAVEKDMSRTALFDIFYQYIKIDLVIPEIEDLSIKIREMNYGYGKYDLNLLLCKDAEKITGKLVFNLDYFDKSRITLFINHYYTLVNNLLSQPTEKLSKIEILSEEEKVELLFSLNKTNIGYPQNMTITDLFSAQIKRTPNHIALKMGNRTVSYDQLDISSNQLGLLLRENGVSSNTVVALLMDRSPETVIGMLGILKAGGAYLPVDVDYPRERKEYLIKDSGASLILTEKRLETKDEYPVSKVYIDDSKKFSGKSCPLSRNSPSDLCYIIYTSGTTGNPKGVMVEHRNVVRLFFNEAFQFDFDSSDVWTMFHSHCFDFSVWEIYGALLFGGKVIIIPKETAQNMEDYLDILKKEKVTILNQTPSTFYSLIQEERSFLLPELCVRYVIFGGEALKPGKLKNWWLKYPKVRLVNMFGITETTVHVTYKEIGAYEIENNIDNIGQPIPTLSVYIWAANLQPVPKGVIGELYVGGAGVARGYVGKEDLTREKFLINPYIPAERVYRSGDLGRMLASGDIEYLGRADNQVKIRGFRIETGEIEVQLSALTFIKECAVVAREKDDERFLIAYYVATGDSKPKAELLRSSLLKKVPDYMVPTYFIQLEQLPLTFNGKLNINALPDPVLAIDAEYTAPSDIIEHKLVEIWSDILKIDKTVISINRSFFEMGGHSLKATVLVNRIFKEWQVKIQLKDIFTLQNIAGIGNCIRAAHKDTYFSLPKAEISPYYRLSSSQKRLYFLYKLDRGQSIGYNMTQIFLVNGDPCHKKLNDALIKLMERHESLRTYFTLVGDEPVQQIVDKAVLELEQFNLGNGNADEIIDTFIRPFNLSKPPLIRAGLIKASPKEFIFVIDLHHIISDGVSNELLIRDLARIYNGDELPVLPLQYKDYAEWQQSKEHQGVIEGQKEFWINEFKEEVSELGLLTDFARPHVKSYEGNTLSFDLNIWETARLKEIAEKEGCTLFMVLLSLYAILLGKLAGQEDVVIGVPAAARPHADLESVVGLFVNTLPIRIHPRGDLMFRAFLVAVKLKTLACFNHSSYPYDELIDGLKIPRNTSHNPLFDVVFAYENFEHLTFSSQELNFIPVYNRKLTSKFDITLTAIERENELSFNLEYSTGLYKEGTIKQFITYFKRLISEIASDLDKKIMDMDLLSESERHHLVIDLNNTKSYYPKDKSIHSLFEEQVKKTPDATAVEFRNNLFTYRQLESDANGLSVLLRKRGIARGSVVAVLLRRSARLVSTILGIMKAGAIYLPLDTSLPKDRIRFMLDDSKCSMVIIGMDESEMASWLQQDLKENLLLVLNIDKEKCESFEFSCLPDNNNPSDAAYIIYTSGSTGKPKGVVIRHQSLVNYSWWAASHYIKGEAVTFPFYTSISFDLTITSVFPPLITGNRILIYDDTENDLLIERIVEENKVDIIKLTPSHLKILASNKWNKLVLGCKIKTLIVGGEKLETSLARDIYNAFRGNIKIYNEYGPTEATVGCMIHTFDPHEPCPSVPVGLPAANTQIYILDRFLRPVPAEVIGEMYISGDGLASSYLFRVDLTRTKFVSNPFVEGTKMYQTGDLAKRLPDGNIEFIGRADNQLKIRGFRVELAEVESNLRSHSQIKEAVVVMGGTDTDQYLVTYYVPLKTIKPEDLRMYLSGLLPNYMVPSMYVEIAFIPLTSNGKVDFKALPDLEKGTSDQYKASSNTIEEKLREIWAEILKIDKEKLSISRSFFEVGGHSLRAASLVNKIFKEFGVEIPLRTIFQYQTIGDLSQFIKEAEKSLFFSIPKILPQEYYALSSSQRRLYFLYELEPSSLAYNMFSFFKLQGNIDKEKIRLTFQGLIARHESLRTSFGVIEGEPVLKIATHVDWIMEEFDSEESMVRPIIDAFIRPFDLSRSPLFRVGLIQLTPQSHILIVDIHHIISDGVSVSILIKDFIALYDKATLLELPLQHKDYTAWQQSSVQHALMLNQRNFWINDFADRHAPLDLPTDFPRPLAKSHMGASLEFDLSEEETTRLKAMAESEGSTMFMLLLSFYTILLSKLSNQEDVVVGITVAGRHHVDLEHIIGMFVNTLPARNFPKGDLSYKDFLSALKAKILLCLENQFYPFEQLIEELRVERDTSRNPLFDVLFTYENFEEASLQIPNVTLTPYNVGYTVSQFDIALFAIEKEGRLNLRFNYSTKLFLKGTIKRFIAYFKTIIKSVLFEPAITIADISLITQVEREYLLKAFNNTEAEHFTGKTVLGLFEKQVEKNPESVAVVFGDASLTYKELNEQANQLGHYLRDKGVREESLVGIFIDRSTDMVIALLGVMKAGGAYVPIEPSYPAERIRYMLEDTGTEIVVTNSSSHPKIPGVNRYTVVSIDTEWSPIKILPKEKPSPQCTSHHVAYVLYTSGSTGKPKGVIIEQHSLANLLLSMSKELDFKATDILLSVTSYGFDIFYLELYLPLICGGKVVIVDRETMVNAKSIGTKNGGICW